MLRRNNLGNLAIVLLLLLNPLLWLLATPIRHPLGFDQLEQRIAAELFASSAMAMMTCALVLALRLKFLEPWFGGLDKMYASHKMLAFGALLFLLLHWLLVLPAKSADLGRQLGQTALIGILLLIMLTLIPRIPWFGGAISLKYQHWRWTHKLIGLFFIVGNLHATNVNTVLGGVAGAGLYWNVMTWIGMLAYLTRELVQPWLQRKHGFEVLAANRPNSSTLELVLRPLNGKPAQRAGQFAFISFPGQGALAEAHPFTISSAPGEENLRFAIKASGDWTRSLMTQAKPGMRAQVEGSYGRLDHQTGGGRQIWIAGGIGVTPFLSWVRNLGSQLTQEVHFFYTVRAEADGLFWPEFADAATKHGTFYATRNVSSVSGSLTLARIREVCGGNIADCHVYLCGPLPMTQAFVKQFKAAGVPAAQLHFEEFNFR